MAASPAVWKVGDGLLICQMFTNHMEIKVLRGHLDTQVLCVC